MILSSIKELLTGLIHPGRANVVSGEKVAKDSHTVTIGLALAMSDRCYPPTA